MLASRYRPAYVFAGAALAFAIHVALAVAAGGLLGLLPHRVLGVIVAVMFAAGAVLLLRGQRGADEHNEHVAPEDQQPGFWPVAATSFGIVLAAEFGDLTQIATATLAARYHAPVSVGIGAVLGLWAVAALAIVGGRALLRLIPVSWITRAAASVMLVMAGLSLFEI